METARDTDEGVGYGLLLGLLTIAAAGYTLVAPTQSATAWGFAASVAFGTLAVAAIHYWG